LPGFAVHLFAIFTAVTRESEEGGPPVMDFTGKLQRGNLTKGRFTCQQSFSPWSPPNPSNQNC